VNIDDCASRPCQNGGTCTDQVNGFACSCAAGFTGPTCAVDVDDCASSPCRNGGTCADRLNGFSCSCAPGFLGTTCEYPVTTSNCTSCGPTGGATTQAGITDCGSPTSPESCGLSVFVPGGTFLRNGADSRYPTTLSPYRLDKYEVTVGRFRHFVAAWEAGWRPPSGSGKHTHLASGTGLTGETGWSSQWTAKLPDYTNTYGYVYSWDWYLRANNPNVTPRQTWTSQPGANERKAQNNLDWYSLYAFCIWDGGFLPTEAEREFAASGGPREYDYPWGNQNPFGRVVANGATAVADVGSLPSGNGLWGHSDLIGNVYEWVLDHFANYTTGAATDPLLVAFGSSASIRGGGYSSNWVMGHSRNQLVRNTGLRADVGGRCARAP
jgi:formylglycine-generating enzyme required for sulfatase activity